MRRNVITAAAAAALVLFAQLAGAKPMNYIGNGCVYSDLVDTSNVDVLRQSFKPTFSVLKKARFVLYQYPLSETSTTLRVELYTLGGSYVGTSNDAVLPAGTSYDDAVGGQAVTFTFGGGIAVTPGTTYRLELHWVSGGASVYGCTAFQLYADGNYSRGTSNFADYDLEFAAAGGGRPK